MVVCLSFLLFFFQRHFTLHEQNAGTFKKKKILIAKLSFFPSPLPLRISPYFSCILICNTLKHTHTKMIMYRDKKKRIRNLIIVVRARVMYIHTTTMLHATIIKI